MDEFSEKGFLGASLRQIVKKRRRDHRGLLRLLFQQGSPVRFHCRNPHAAALMGRFMEAQTSFAELPEEQQPDHMGVESSDCVHWMVDYICRHAGTG